MTVFDVPEDVAVFDGFKDMDEAALKELYGSLNLAMTFKDFLHIQNYYKNEETQRSVRDRDPRARYILVRSLPPYHILHRTQECDIRQRATTRNRSRIPTTSTLLTTRRLYKGRDDKFVCLMDLALMAMKKLRKEGKLAGSGGSLTRSTPAPSLFRWRSTERPRSGSSTSRTRPTTTRPRSSRSVARQPALAVRSVTRFPDVPMYTRQCASQVPLTRPRPLNRDT